MDASTFDELTRLLATSTSRRQTLKALAGSALAGALSLLDGASTSASDGKKTKVQICHRTHSTSNLMVLIEVDESAVPDHRAHGDTLAPSCQGGELKRDCTCVCPAGTELCQGNCVDLCPQGTRRDTSTCTCQGSQCIAGTCTTGISECGTAGSEPCFCFTTFTDGSFCAINVPCGPLVECPGGQDQCPPETTCLKNTCCPGKPNVCYPNAAAAQCVLNSGSA